MKVRVSSDNKLNFYAQVSIILFFLATTMAKTMWSELEGYTFEKYVKEFGKDYKCPQEFSLRRSIFEKKLQGIRAHNRDPSQSWKKGVNHLSDRTEEVPLLQFNPNSYFSTPGVPSSSWLQKKCCSNNESTNR
jgi:hypothetical protein